MKRHHDETPAQKRERLLREARDLVEDRARRCELCGERMRYWPQGAKTAQRAAGRYSSWRCDLCHLGPHHFAAALEGRALSPAEELHSRRHQAATLVEHFEELEEAAKPLRGEAAELFPEALERLCLQMQQMAETMDALAQRIEEENDIVLFSAHAHLDGSLRRPLSTQWSPSPAQA